MDALKKRIEAAGQTQIFSIIDKYESLSKEDQTILIEELESVEWETLDEMYKMTIAPPAEVKGIAPPSADPSNPAQLVVSSKTDRSSIDKWYETGLKAIAEGTAGVVIMAGGQGTRLGFDGPKGTYEIGAITHATLFEFFIKRAIKLRQLAALAGFASKMGDVKIPIGIMCSTANYQQTVDFFEEHCNFGYPSADLYFFKQTMVPCFNNDGKVMMDSPCTMAKNPNGNGGIFSSMGKTGVLQKFLDMGIEYVHVHGIDNVLTKVLDPVFLGYCMANNAEVGNKTCTKAEATEKVGVFAACDGPDGKKIPTVVEYSELSDELADKRVTEGGEFLFGSGNICNHMFKTEFIKRLVDARFLETNPNSLHAAFKKIPFLNDSGTLVKPDAPNGVKMEMFIFDAFWFADKVFGLEVPREEEFAPVKNADGKDSPQSAREMMTALHESWLLKAGADINAKSTGHLEISPMVSYAGEGLEEYQGEMIYRGNPIVK